MSSEVKASLEELASLAQEIHTKKKELKTLNERKKELEETVISFLEKEEKPGLRLNNIVFLATDKMVRARKKKAEVVKDSIEVLKNAGIQGDPAEILRQLEESRKGEQSSKSVLKMKAASIFQ